METLFLQCTWQVSILKHDHLFSTNTVHDAEILMSNIFPHIWNTNNKQLNAPSSGLSHNKIYSKTHMVPYQE